LTRKTVPWVQRRDDLNEYKREQAAPGLKVTSRAFGLGRRMPIAQQYADVVQISSAECSQRPRPANNPR
jgi:hypothetical protein